MTPSSSAEAQNLTLRLHTAGLPLKLIFAPEHADLVDELRVLWTHLVVSEVAAAVEESRAADGCAAETIMIEFVAKPAPDRPETVLLRPGPSASYAVSGTVTRAVIRALLGERLLLHAGAVDLPGLGLVVMVGASGAGKSTATSRLGRRGQYLTDELAILEPRSGALIPYPKPVSLRIPERTGKRDVALAELDLSMGAGGQVPQWVLLLERRLHGAGNGPAVARRVPLADALRRIVGQSSSIWKVPGGLAALAELVNAVGGALEVEYDEAEEIESLLHGAPAPLIEAFEQVAGQSATQAAGPGEYVVAPFEQALLMKGSMLVLTDRTLLHLSGVGRFVWDVLSDAGSLSREQIEGRLTELLGSHPEQSVWLEQALADLVTQGVIRRGEHH